VAVGEPCTPTEGRLHEHDRLRIPTIALAATTALAFALAGCGGTTTADTSGAAAPTPAAAPVTSTPTADAAPTAPNALTVAMDEFAFAPRNATVAAGEVTITAPNKGNAAHELVVIKSSGPADALPTKANGEVDEDAIAAAALPGEIGETAAGAAGTLKVKLTPGKYIMVCNEPGHFKAGMHGTLNVV
jgi:uncharacterized cupredoxin-like copper-binding protein